MQPIVNQIKRLHLQTTHLLTYTNVSEPFEKYTIKIRNSLEMLKFLKEKVERRLNEIIPPQNFRQKRGLVNLLGTAFKLISGNLDSADGDRYNNLIKNLETNQQILQTKVTNQGTLSKSVIERFNQTLQQLYKNDKMIEEKINQIRPYLNEINSGRNFMLFVELNNDFINMYEVVDSILQDIENSMVFSQLGVLHPTIITNQELYTELQLLRNQLDEGQLPLQAIQSNVPIIAKTIKPESFMSQLRIIHILHVPIAHNRSFDLFHLYAVPIQHQGQFKFIMSRNKYLITDRLYYMYTRENCQKLMPERYLCPNSRLEEIGSNSPCEVQILQRDGETSNCHQIEAKVTEPILNRLDETHKMPDHSEKSYCRKYRKGYENHPRANTISGLSRKGAATAIPKLKPASA
ncbi:uncharacterized protein [Euwallacea fornicatus]|uniref:uncharacterized protein n=1 Tax=Euwallacea fornicatus TaxID=995702 RepID=UPI00338E2984